MAIVLGASALPAQRAASGPKARYQMDVATTSGFGGMGAMMGGGGMGAMAAMFGGGRGGGSVQHTLLLRLGSTLAPSGGDPHADHFMPAGADLGASVPLETPQRATTPKETVPGAPPDFQRPKGRMLIFWGCGAHAGPGQPVVIDFSRLAAGQMPPHLFSTDVPVETGPTESNSRTFGDWPNGKSHKTVGAQASLIGNHRVSGNYSPDITFALNQDFLAPLRATSQAAADGSTPMSWNAVPAATGYFATLFGAEQRGNGDGDVVMWSSAGRQEFGGGLSDWLAPATVQRLIGQHVVMPPTQTSCTVPAEVKQAAGEFMMVQLYAYGPEADFAYPPRPANPKTPWNLEWTAKVRYRSTTGLMLGMPGMASTDEDDADSAERSPDQTKSKRCKPHGLGGFLKAQIGGGC
jgi:hypothetical protein